MEDTPMVPVQDSTDPQQLPLLTPEEPNPVEDPDAEC